jgi:hypothetical protein
LVWFAHQSIVPRRTYGAVGVPPPILWTQNPCFLEFTGRVALQNPANKGVICKIVILKAFSGEFCLLQANLRRIPPKEKATAIEARRPGGPDALLDCTKPV